MPLKIEIVIKEILEILDALMTKIIKWILNENIKLIEIEDFYFQENVALKIFC